jgi:WD40 repeat protein
VATGSSQPKIFNRDGVLQMTFVKGDPYLADMANTKGHTMICTGAQWHPSLKNVVMTSSMDGTVRIWDLEGPLALDKLVCKKVCAALPLVKAVLCGHSFSLKLLRPAWTAFQHPTDL